MMHDINLDLANVAMNSIKAKQVQMFSQRSILTLKHRHYDSKISE